MLLGTCKVTVTCSADEMVACLWGMVPARSACRLSRTGAHLLPAAAAGHPRGLPAVQAMPDVHDLTELRLPRSREKGQKCVQLDTALAVWQLLFSQMQWPLGGDWIDFVQKQHGRAISRDTWMQLLDFVKVRPQQE